MINTFAYGVPFVSNNVYFEAKCDCEKIIKARTLCSEIDKNDPLKGLSDINLTGIILESNQYLKLNKSNLRNKNCTKKVLYF